MIKILDVWYFIICRYLIFHLCQYPIFISDEWYPIPISDIRKKTDIPAGLQVKFTIHKAHSKICSFNFFIYSILATMPFALSNTGEHHSIWRNIALCTSCSQSGRWAVSFTYNFTGKPSVEEIRLKEIPHLFLLCNPDLFLIKMIPLELKWASKEV